MKLTLELTAAEWTELMNFSDDEFEFRTDYSGRGMYGRTCPAIVGSLRDYVNLVAEIALEVGRWEGGDNTRDWDEASRVKPILNALVTDVSIDSMGLDQVFYWRNIRIVAEVDNPTKESR